MRGKKAKALRRIAREKTAGWPALSYNVDPKTRQVTLGKCTRLYYQQLKKVSS